MRRTSAGGVPGKGYRQSREGACRSSENNARPLALFTSWRDEDFSETSPPSSAASWLTLAASMEDGLDERARRGVKREITRAIKSSSLRRFLMTSPPLFDPIASSFSRLTWFGKPVTQISKMSAF